MRAVPVWGRWQRAVLAIAMGASGLCTSAQAGEVSVAVAANFAGTFKKIAAAFQADTGHAVISSIGSTGKFHQQVRAGAPFDVLLSADDETPQRLEQEGFTVPGHRFTYARGRLALWSVRPGVVDAQGAVLRKGGFKTLAVADARLSPYGAASLQVLRNLNVLDSVQSQLVQGESIGQAHQFVATGNADLGFVAMSQVIASGKGSWWVVPDNLHTPLRQDAVLLKRAEQNASAKALWVYLRSGKARAIIQAHGYHP